MQQLYKPLPDNCPIVLDSTATRPHVHHEANRFEYLASVHTIPINWDSDPESTSSEALNISPDSDTDSEYC